MMFKAGDKVRCICPYLRFTVGNIYTVLGAGYNKYPEIMDDKGYRRWPPSEVFEVVLGPSVKDTNPKDAMGTAKVPMLSVVPLRVLGDVALALFEGARKYGRHNYRPAGVRASVYMDAVGRHLAAWYEGEDTDPDSGVSHVTKAIAALMVLRDSMMQGNMVDDRPPAVEPWVSGMNETAKAIIEKYPECVPPYTQKN